MSAKHGRGSSGSGLLAAPHANREDPTPGLKAGVNPLYGSEIVGGESSSPELMEPEQARDTGKPRGSGQAAPATRDGAPARRPSSARKKRASARGGSPQSTLTTSTTQSQSSNTSRRARTSPAGAPSSLSKANNNSTSRKGEPRSGATTRSNSGGKSVDASGPAPLVPALLAPVPPPPRKRKGARVGDIETGGEATVLEDAPHKTLMEMFQSYLKKQDLYTRIMLVVVLLVLAGGVLGAYVVMLVYAIQDQSVKYITLCVVFTLIFGWVLWKYCFGDERMQDQSAIAQDIATLYAAIPDHTAVRGVSSKGRAQFTDFKYEKAEMMFTAVTDDGVSLGSERGSELMMDGADPSCPLCNVAYVEGAELCLLPCLHVFHKTCINKWCNRHIVCPLCKRHLEAPEPLHNLTLSNAASGVQSEPGGHGGHQSRPAWRHMLGSGAPGPASGHGSARGLGGTRSDDGLWNDRVLNAAQRQVGSTGHNRVTSFSSETRRANAAARGRSNGPPQSSSAGASAVRVGQQRSQSISGTSGRTQHRIQRKRSSSFTTANERARGSGRVAHGTAPHRGGAGSSRGGECSSPRSRSDIGVGSRESDRARASDAMLSRHASRLNSGSAGKKGRGRSEFSEDTSGAWSDGAVLEPAFRAEPKRKMAVVTVTSQKTKQKGVHSRGQGPAVITVRKVKAGPKSSSHVRRGSGRDTARSGGENSEPEFGGERVFKTNSSMNRDHNDKDSPDEVTTKALSYGPRKTRVTRERSSSREPGGHRRNYSAGSHCDDDSPDEVTTKALTYAPRKPRVSKDGTGHRRQSSAGSASADDNGSARKHRRRPSGSGSHSAIAAAAATAEAVSRLLTRSAQEERSSSSSSRGSGGTRPATGGGGDPSGHSSGGESGSDGHADGRRNSRGSGRPGSLRRNSTSAQKVTPTKTAPITRGTPAPPMAAARVATWNSNASAMGPVIDPSFSISDADLPTVDAGGDPAGASGGAAAIEALTDGASSPNGSKRNSAGRGWSLRIPSSAGSSEFFGFGGGGGSGSGGHGSGNAGNSGASAEPPPDAEQHPHTAAWKGSGSFASKVFLRGSASGKPGPPGTRVFGSGSTARTGNAGFGTDSEDERITEPLSESAGRVLELIQTYEKSRSSSDEKGKPENRAIEKGTPGKRRSKSLLRRRGSAASVSSMHDLAATESEQDEEVINRPKLTYKRKNSRGGSVRPVSSPEAEPYSSTTSAMHVSVVDDGGATEVPPVNPDGDNWGSEEPYARPKLSYGSGLVSASKRGSFRFDSVPGVPSSSH